MAKRKWSPAVRGRGEVTARNGCRAFVRPTSGGWAWDVKPVGFEVIDPRREVASGKAKNKTRAKAAASRVLASCRRS